MIAQPLQDAFSPQGIKPHLTHPPHDLILLRHLIPWHPIIDRLVPFYHAQKGRTGHSLRILVAASLLSRLRPLSARKVIENMQENRSMQYFCHGPAQSLLTFLTPSTLCRFRKRLGQEGPLILEAQVFQPLKRASGIDAAMMLMDAPVLESPIIYPTDVQLLCKACGKMAVVAREGQSEPWGDQPHVKQRWRASNLHPQARLASLRECSPWFVPAFASFNEPLEHLPNSPLRQRWSPLLEVLRLLKEPTPQPLAGDSHLDQRLGSLDALEARPRKKGQRHPSTALGPTLPMTCHRQGVMIPTDHGIGPPNAKTLSGPSLERLRERLHASPGTAVPALGFRSAQNLTLQAQEIDPLFMGRRWDGDAAQQEACRKARAAPDGLIAVAQHLRGFGRRLYRGLTGATLGTRLGQCASKVHKFLPLYRAEALEESTLIKLCLSAISLAGSQASVDRPPKRDGMARCPPPVRPQMAATGPD